MSGMKEQMAQHRYQGVPRRPAAYTMPASPHGMGHAAGLHGEDQPYQSGDYDVRHTAPGTAGADVENDEDDDFSPTKPPRSAIRYRATLTADQAHPRTPVGTGREVEVRRASRLPQPVQRPRARLAGHPAEMSGRRPAWRVHWLIYVGLALSMMLFGWVLLGMVSQWWQVTQDDWRYGRPRTFQTDAVVGHNDSPAHPSHFLVLNLNRQINIIEFPSGDSAHAKIYTGPTLIGPGQDLAVVTLTFRDVNGDGKPDLILNFQDSHFVLINDHGQFRPARPGEAVSL